MEVNIPAGIEEEQVLKVRGGGEASSLGGSAGDLFVRIHIKPYSDFKRKGFDVISKLYITFSQAVLGDKVDVETVEGFVKLKTPAGIEAGDFLRIKGQGIKNFGGFGQGNHLVEIRIRTPKKVSWSQKRLIKELAAEGL
jgi:molecular chaperone DnaJ